MPVHLSVSVISNVRFIPLTVTGEIDFDQGFGEAALSIWCGASEMNGYSQNSLELAAFVRIVCPVQHTKDLGGRHA
jgi:hypothetical protein